ncbi:MAG: exonuclease subunit SbcC [Cyanobacteria bacterium P01_H01_bin.15]
MIPLQLRLKNFLSYRTASLDFRGLHTACVCGANGAGKSSLLEGITWALWGQCRAAIEDDAIYGGEQDTRVDFEFEYDRQVYRVIRTRQRGRSGGLEFQICDRGNYRSLNSKGVRATQQQINTVLHLDYDTFINSAYLRQGRADEFMLRRPTERKQILAALLKLDRYETLAQKAKDKGKALQGQVVELEKQLNFLVERLAQQPDLAASQEQTQARLATRQDQQAQSREHLQTLKLAETQRQSWQQQLTWQQEQQQTWQTECDRRAQDCQDLQGEIRQLEELLTHSAKISQDYQTYQHLRAEAQLLTQKAERWQQAQALRQEQQETLRQKETELTLKIQAVTTQMTGLQQQQAENQTLLQQAPEIQTAIATLRERRQSLAKLDQLHHRVTPLLQEQQRLHTLVEQQSARLSARLEQLQVNESRLGTELAQIPQVAQSVQTMQATLAELNEKREYRQQLEARGLERQKFRERLQESQRQCQRRYQEVTQKLALLESPQAICPLCEQDLAAAIHENVLQKTRQQHQDLQNSQFTLREQMAACDRELQVLRAEFRRLSEELSSHDSYLQQLGHLEAKLEATSTLHQQIQALKQESKQVEQALVSRTFAPELQAELAQLEQTLNSLAYDEQTHALVRGEVERWRWAEIKFNKLEDAQKRQAKFAAQLPTLEAQRQQLEKQLTALRQSSPWQQHLKRLDDYCEQLAYDPAHHQTVQSTLQQNHLIELRHQQLQKAHQALPRLHQKLNQLHSLRLRAQQRHQTLLTEVKNLTSKLQAFADRRGEIQMLEQTIQTRRQQLDDLIAEQARQEQELSQLETLREQQETLQTRIGALKKQVRVYDALQQAFGRNGIQALTIENALPQLEAETNQILSRLSNNQLHIQFLTQRAGRSRPRKSQKWIETLDILIADAQGTRPYETYSGGEAFRVNFAIRLALARLLAQRSGTALQMLVIDEGFGTQDPEGCDRLIGSINAIADDFACILAVTHMRQFKEAFQTRIEITKTQAGSELKIVS